MYMPRLSYHTVFRPHFFQRIISARKLSSQPKVPSHERCQASNAEVVDASDATDTRCVDTPEEPIFSSYEEGNGYYLSAAFGRGLRGYHFMRKVSSLAVSPAL
jgi:hypothetical protein